MSSMDVKSKASSEMEKTGSADPYLQKVKLPSYIWQTFLSILVFLMGASMRGKCSNWEKNEILPFVTQAKKETY